MKRFIRIIMWLLFFFAIFIVAAYLLPQVRKIERIAVIDASPKVVFSQINDLHSWEKWAKWNQMDPEMEISYINHGVGEGGGYTWKSGDEKLGSGKIIIVQSVPYDSIVALINFSEKGAARTIFELDGIDGKTEVTWRLIYDTGYNPFSRWKGLLMDKFAGPDFDEGLENLNVVCKVQVQEKSLVEELVTMDEFDYAGMREKVSFVEVSLKMEEMFGKVSSFIDSSSTGAAGYPFAIYHQMSGEEIDLECGVPITNKVAGNGTVITGTYPETLCAEVDYYGDYRALEDAHTALQAWMEERKFKLAGAPMEFYITDPATEPDPEKWLTKIYYPVRR